MQKWNELWAILEWWDGFEERIISKYLGEIKSFHLLCTTHSVVNRKRKYEYRDFI
jgi:hypothetical protein